METNTKAHVLGPEGFDNFLFSVVMLSEFERIYTQVIAEKDREIAFNRERMLEIAIDMFLEQRI